MFDNSYYTIYFLVLPFRNPSCTDAKNYLSLLEALTTKVLLCLHGRDDEDFQVNYGQTVLILLFKLY